MYAWALLSQCILFLYLKMQKSHRTFLKIFTICIFSGILFSFNEGKAQCNTNASTCSPGTIGPFNFVTPGPVVSSCLDWIGPSTGYIMLHINTPGDLNMLINGDATTGFLDVAVFNIPSGQNPCAAIQNNANEIGCNYADFSTGCNQFGTAFSCGSSVPAPAVTAGQDLMIVVENWSGSSNDFTLTLGPSPGAQTGPPNATITPAGPFCSTAPAVQLAAVDMGGTWSGPGTSSTGVFNPATAGPGTHTITYSIGASPCNASSTTTIVVNSPTNLSISPAATTICAGQSATLTASGAASYSWSPGGATTSSITVSPTTTTVYTVSSPGCISPATATVTVPPSSGITVNSPSICAGQTALLTASGASSYSWSAGANPTGANTADASPLTTTTYTVTGTNSGCSTTGTSTVTVNPIPVVSVNSPFICPGTTATLTAGGANSFSWSAGATPTGLNTADVSPAASTTYTVTGTTLGCSNTAVSAVTLSMNISVDAGPDDTICFGGSTAIAATPGGAGYIYSWSPATGLSNPGIANPVASPASSTTYTINITTLSGCAGSDSVSIFSDPQITLALAGLPATCNGGTDGQTIVIPSGGSGNYAYSWSSGCTGAACNVAAATYTVTVTDTWGCTATGTSTVTEPPAVTATTTQTNANCSGLCDGTATVTPAGGTLPYNYVWSTVPVQNGQTATGLCAGTYTCTLTDRNGCSSSTPVTVTITQPPPLALASIPNASICGSGSAILTANASGGAGSYNYSWSPSTGLSNPAIANPVASPPSTTVYTVTVTDAPNGCTATGSVTVSVGVPLGLSVSGSEIICPGVSIPVSATAYGGTGSGYSYSWVPSAGLNNDTLASAIATPTATTTYTVTLNDGCSLAVTATVLITVLPVPTPVISSDVLSGCVPLCVDFNDTSGIVPGSVTGWRWNFGDGSPDSTSQHPSHCYSTAGTYTVTLTEMSPGSCTAVNASPYMITANPLPSALFTAPASSGIYTPEVQYTDHSTISFGPLASWSWRFGDPLASASDDSSNLQNPSHRFSDTGTYCAQLIVTSGAGCRDTSDLCITIDPEFSFYIPNSFSPNDNGNNDEFFGKGDFINIDKYEMDIYDRWGNLVFHSAKIDEHWNGKMNNKGEIMQEDVYVYVIKLSDKEGRKHKYIGGVTLFR